MQCLEVKSFLFYATLLQALLLTWPRIKKHVSCFLNRLLYLRIKSTFIVRWLCAVPGRRQRLQFRLRPTHSGCRNLIHIYDSGYILEFHLFHVHNDIYIFVPDASFGKLHTHILAPVRTVLWLRSSASTNGWHLLCVCIHLP